MPNGGKITLETSNTFLTEAYCSEYDEVSPGQYVLISVTDEGVGMQAEVIEQAFEPFFTTKGPGLGTGLGLSQAYGFTKQSGGHIKIYSEVGVGTAVKLYLPRAFPINTKVSNMQSEEVRQGKGESILIVEDDTGVRNYLLDLLVELKYAAKAADSGEAAIKLINDPREKIDLSSNRCCHARNEWAGGCRHRFVETTGSKNTLHDRVFAQCDRSSGSPGRGSCTDSEADFTRESSPAC